MDEPDDTAQVRGDRVMREMTTKKPDPEGAWYVLLDEISDSLVMAEREGLEKGNRLRALVWMLVSEMVDDDGGGFTSEANLHLRLDYILHLLAPHIINLHGSEGETSKIAELWPRHDDPRTAKLRAKMVEMLRKETT
jgi:hypothetical protein